MKHTLLSFLLSFISGAFFAQIPGTWDVVNYCSEAPLSAIACTKSGTPSVFTTGSTHGALFRSFDGGVVWDSIHFDYEANLAAIDFPTNDTGYVAGGSYFAFPPTHPGKLLYRSTDGGHHWETLMDDYLSFPFIRLDFLDGHRGYLLTDDSLYYTDDAGLSLQLRNVPVDDYLIFPAFAFNSQSTGFLCTYRPAAGGDPNTSRSIYRTDDGAQTWTPVYTDTAQGNNWSYAINTISFADPNTGFAGTGDGMLLQTIDGGQTWAVFDSFPGMYIVDVAYLSLDTFYFMAHGQGPFPFDYFIYETVDGGQTWSIEIPYASDLFELAFADNTNGFSSGGNKVIKREAHLLGVQAMAGPNEQFYPNPTDGVLHFNQLADTWEAYDAMGRLLANGNALDGSANVESLPSGVYVLLLKKEGRPVGKGRFLK